MSPLLVEAGTETEGVITSLPLSPPPPAKCLLEGPLLSSLHSAMSALLQEAVMTTRGWSVSQLMALHCDLRYALQRIKSLPLDVQGVKSVRSLLRLPSSTKHHHYCHLLVYYCRNSLPFYKITIRWWSTIVVRRQQTHQISSPTPHSPTSRSGLRTCRLFRDSAP